MLESRLYQGSTTRSSSPPLSPVGQVCAAASQPIGEVFQRRASCSTGPRRGPHSVRYWSLGVGRSCQGCQVLTNSTPGPGMCPGRGVQGCTALGGALKGQRWAPIQILPRETEAQPGWGGRGHGTGFQLLGKGQQLLLPGRGSHLYRGSGTHASRVPRGTQGLSSPRSMAALPSGRWNWCWNWHLATAPHQRGVPGWAVTG